MFGFNSFEIGLLMTLGSFCIFAIINRICVCIENVAAAKAIAKCDTNIRKEDLEEAFNGINKK